MRVEKSELIAAASKTGISPQQAEELWNSLNASASSVGAKFDLSSLLYYFGAMIVILAMSWYLGVAWEHLGGEGILIIALSYMLAFIIAGSILWKRSWLKIPGGLFITMGICLIPLAVYGFQKWTGWWIVEEPGQYRNFFDWIRGGWFVMEIATIIGGTLALKYCRFPFLTAPIFFSLWFMSMDATPLIVGHSEYTWDDRLRVSVGFGIVLLIIAYLMDLCMREDFAFWGYLFGVLTFWTGLSLLNSTSEWNNFLYFLINVGMVFLSVLLQRTVFLIFGSIGILGYISDLFYRYFSNSAWFPVALSIVGILVIFMGIMYQKKHKKIEASILNLIPQSFQRWLPKHR